MSRICLNAASRSSQKSFTASIASLKLGSGTDSKNQNKINATSQGQSELSIMGVHTCDARSPFFLAWSCYR